MAPRRPIRILDYTEKAHAYPRELMLDFATGALYAKTAEGAEITIMKPLKITDEAGTEFGSFTPNEAKTIAIKNATDEVTGLLTAEDHKAYTDHIASYATDALAGHIKLAGETDVPAGDADDEEGVVGVSNNAARADHQHPIPTKVAAAGDADKLATPRKITLKGGVSGEVDFDGSTDIEIEVSVAKQDTAGTADEANKLTEGRKIILSGDVSGEVTFDGSEDVTIEVVVAKPDSAGEADKLATPRTVTFNGGATGSFEFDGSDDVTCTLTVPVPQASTTPALDAGEASAGESDLYAREDHVHPLQVDVSGNAGTATKLASAQTIQVTGAVTGSVSFDGSEEATLNLSRANGTASKTTYFTTIGTEWNGTAAPYSQVITVPGILDGDNPVVDCVLDSVYATAKAQLEAYANIYQIVTGTNSITVRSTYATVTPVPIQLVCIREA